MGCNAPIDFQGKQNMSTPMSYTEVANEILAKLRGMEIKLDRIAYQVNAIYRDEEPTPIRQSHDDFPSDKNEEDIKRDGSRIAYNLIDDVVEVAKFKDFIYEAKKNSRHFDQFTRDFIDIADKNFADIRLSSKHLAIMKSVYFKLYNKDFPFKYKQGYMYKLEGYPLVWEWF